MTPVRLVWNSSQKFRGLSLNDLLLKGPDVLNPICAVLLKFRRGAFTALGDIKNMYNSVWLEDREVYLHRFLWRDSEEEELCKYAITRVNIGDKPAGCIAQLAMRESANLPQFSRSYVDNIVISYNSLDLKIMISKSSQRNVSAGKQEVTPKAVILPNQLKDEDNKALGLGYTVEDDKFHIMDRINFSKRKEKMRLGQDLLLGQVRAQTPDPLTQRELLSQVSGLYDPIGLATPIKQGGAILVRRAFQEAKPRVAPLKKHGTLHYLTNLEKMLLIFLKIMFGRAKFARASTPAAISAEPVSKNLACWFVVEESRASKKTNLVFLSYLTTHGEVAARNGTDWQWKVQPADSLHRNGAAEAAMPRVQSHEDSVQYITPNALLLGRASSSGDFKSFDMIKYPYQRLREMQCQINRFWRFWSQFAGPNFRNYSRGVVQDVTVKIVPSYCVSVIKPVRKPEVRPVNSAASKHPASKDFQPIILHRDVRRLVVLLPVEEQAGGPGKEDGKIE
ncbi:Endoplasmic reticulum mannosyl-oligosaccharide 1,2-alpha-mannosidase [Labeo rohita]|uniref:Endoplasmic reticulum mannosyl-oligosaccharide 1,2-alpha-mannosidase n=1 Tax=Labeo rohita TaxID=84645 RepID=A0ABQ8LMT1_LABRO|nr:Endoplasmic reticulum mannosyl-oligosaccharide 1,2-alpha-mannosidase [Labeo rohita]